MTPRSAAIAMVLALSCALAGGLRAQGTPLLAPEECYQFAFGTWSPALPVYHPSVPDIRNSYPAKADSTRAKSPSDSDARSDSAIRAAPAPPDWAARLPDRVGASTSADSLLVLFPGWWPVGIGITWTSTRGDTLIGRAQAFVSDGRLPVPSTVARAVRIPCRK